MVAPTKRPKVTFIRVLRCDVGSASYDKCRKVMLRRGTVREQFVGVDDHIDPRPEETIGAPM